MIPKLIKITSLSLLLIIIGSFALGIIADKTAQPGMNHSNCFGPGCGPIGHLVLHSYTFSETASTVSSPFHKTSLLLFEKQTPGAPSLDLEAPPPEFSLA